jgi:esterase/lipase
MKKALVVLLAVAALAGVYASGPRARADVSFKPVSVPSAPSEVEKYVRRSEARFGDIRPGAEKLIVWNNPARKNVTRYSIVYVHGYSACRQELAPVVARVAGKLRANVFYTRLKGHLRGPDALAGVTAGDWLRDTLEAYEVGSRIGEKVIIIGNSTGCTLVTWLMAQKRPSDVAAVILISPNFGPKNLLSKAVLWPWGGQLTGLVFGKYREWTPRNEGEKKYWNHKQATGAVVTLMSLIRYVDGLDLSRFERPLLVIYSPEDRIVDTEMILKKYAEIGSKTKAIYPFTGSQDEYQHILAGDIISPRTTPVVSGMITDFLFSQGIK